MDDNQNLLKHLYSQMGKLHINIHYNINIIFKKLKFGDYVDDDLRKCDNVWISWEDSSALHRRINIIFDKYHQLTSIF